MAPIIIGLVAGVLLNLSLYQYYRYRYCLKSRSRHFIGFSIDLIALAWILALAASPIVLTGLFGIGGNFWMHAILVFVLWVFALHAHNRFKKENPEEFGILFKSKRS